MQLWFPLVKKSIKTKGFSANYMSLLMILLSVLIASVAENETVGIQNDGLVGNSGNLTTGENSMCHIQVIERNFSDSIRRKVDSVVAAVGNRIHDKILTAMNWVFMPGVELAVRSVTGSPGRGLDSVVQNP